MSTGNEAIDYLKESSPLALFPELLSYVVKNSKLGKVTSGRVLRQRGAAASHVFVSLDNELKAFVPTGRPSETKLVRRYEGGALVGLADVVSGTGYSTTVVSEHPSNVMYIESNVFKKWIATNPHGFALLSFLNVNPSVLGFGLSCLRKSVPASQVLKLLQGVDKKETPHVPDKPILDLQQILFVVSGSGFARILEDGQPVADVLLYPGVTVGHALLNPDNKIKIQIFPTRGLVTHSLDLAAVRQSIGPEFAKVIAAEEWSGNAKAAERRGKSGSNVVVHKVPLEVLHDYNETADIAKIKKVSGGPDEAALAALVNIALLNGSEFSEVHAQTEIETSVHLSLGRLAEILERQGLMTRCMKCTISDLHLQRLPLLVIFKERPAVLVHADESTALVLDSHKGLIEMDAVDFDANWTRQALEVMVSPVESNVEGAAEKGSLGDMREIADHAYNEMLSDDKAYNNIFKVGVVCVVLQLLMPQFFQYILDQVLMQKKFAMMPILSLGFLLVVIAGAIGNGMRTYFEHLKSNTQTVFTSSILLRQLMQFPNLLVGTSRAGEYNSRWAVVDGVIHCWNEIMGKKKMTMTLVLISLGIVFAYSWVIGTICVVTGALHIWIRRLYMAQRLHRLVGVSTIRQQGYEDFIEHLSNVAQIRSRNAQGKIADRIDEAILKLCQIYNHSNDATNFGAGLGELVTQLSSGICVAILILQAQAHTMSTGAFVALATYVAMYWAALTKLGETAEWEAFVKYEMTALTPFIRADMEYSKLHSRRVKPQKLQGKIRFENVGYKYLGAGGFGLHNLNFEILPGQTVAIVGQNGSGKTTVGKIMAGLIKPQAGSIYFDEVNSKFTSALNLRDQIGYISHKPVLFEGTVLSNITFGDDSPDLERAKEAAMRACAHTFISNLPGGYNHIVTGRDSSFSLGEQMLIHISRALYRDPKILIVDDANVSIDAQVARTLSTNLRNFMKDRTVILISHTISTLRQADQIIVLKNGTIAEAGTHDELMIANREYMQLYRSQVNAY